METITLYTGEHGYNLFKNGLAFLASKDKKWSHNYEVIAPIENVVTYPLEDDTGCYDVIKIDGVTINEVKERVAVLPGH